MTSDDLVALARFVHTNREPLVKIARVAARIVSQSREPKWAQLYPTEAADPATVEVLDQAGNVVARVRR